LDEEIYMRIPEAYVRYMLEVHKNVTEPSTHVLLLKNATNGFDQAPRQWWSMLKEAMARCNCSQSK
jgi:hypothetical protein